MSYSFVITNNLEKFFFDRDAHVDPLSSASFFKNEIFSFQVVASCDINHWVQEYPIRFEIDSPLEPYIEVSAVDYVPVYYTGAENQPVGDYIAKGPALFPDILRPLWNRCGKIQNHQMRAFWFAIDVKSELSGQFLLSIKAVRTDTEETVGELSLPLDIINCELPPLPIINTGWFHCDSLAVVHNVGMMSEEHFDIIEKYVNVYAKFGHNMILTPIFTPPLDTDIGYERPTMQLVDVTYENGRYTFGFSKLERFIAMCQKNGIRYFEMAHLFTQWGAKNAPKIMATVDGEYKRIFGWETEALGDDYKTFLSAFLPALTDFLRQKGLEKSVYFHISDEPTEGHLEHYGAIKSFLTPLLEGFTIMDALSNYAFYEKGCVDLPVVATDHAEPFLEQNVHPMFLYYCTSQNYRVANRFIAMPASRNRVLGLQLYKTHADGFLQWGFDFYFTRHAREVIDPFRNTGSFQGGDSFIVYPMDQHGNPTLSTRLFVFHDAFQDVRALYLLESKIGRENVLALFPEVESLSDYPRDSLYYVTLREKINQKIKNTLA